MKQVGKSRLILLLVKPKESAREIALYFGYLRVFSSMSRISLQHSLSRYWDPCLKLHLRHYENQIDGVSHLIDAQTGAFN